MSVKVYLKMIVMPATTIICIQILLVVTATELKCNINAPNQQKCNKITSNHSSNSVTPDWLTQKVKSTKEKIKMCLNSQIIVQKCWDNKTQIHKVLDISDEFLNRLIGQSNAPSLLALLFDIGLDVNRRTLYVNQSAICRERMTLLSQAAIRRADHTARFLLDRGADVEMAACFGKTPLMYAAHLGYLDTARLLVAGGADVNAKNAFDKTALHFAAFHGDFDVTHFLIGEGACVTAGSSDGTTALMFAAQRGNHWIFKLLLDEGAQVNTVDSQKHTSLHLAALNGQNCSVKHLLDFGANKYVLDFNNKTAKDLALSNNYTVITDCLSDEFTCRQIC
ncbi:ankyrin homolog [Bacillus rossius redtenbacheri]|uniref:ankyrin homolog n=1 Tax=Bacillus rossius redtenbacheri TaxID=93214 RepID=UPI002FDE7629